MIRWPDEPIAQFFFALFWIVSAFIAAAWIIFPFVVFHRLRKIEETLSTIAAKAQNR